MSAMNAFRSVLFVISMYATMIVMGLAWLPALVLPKGVTLFGIRTFVRIVRFELRWICGVRTVIRGQDHLPPAPYIYAAKHQCMWDVFVPFLITPAPAIIMKRELLWYPVLGWYALKAGMIPIDRAGAARALRAMISTAEERAGEGRVLVIFPEGTRRPPGEAGDYHAAGLGGLYKRLDLPVVPVATNSGLTWPARGLVRRPGPAHFEILPPLPAGLDRRELMRRLEAVIEPASAALLEEGLAAQGRRREPMEKA